MQNETEDNPPANELSRGVYSHKTLIVICALLTTASLVVQFSKVCHSETTKMKLELSNFNDQTSPTSNHLSPIAPNSISIFN